jgi:hypothetical protein
VYNILCVTNIYLNEYYIMGNQFEAMLENAFIERLIGLGYKIVILKDDIELNYFLR